MRLGISELMWNNQQRFQNEELEYLLKKTLRIEPLGEIYKKTQALPPIPIRSTKLLYAGGPIGSELTSQFIQDLQEFMGHYDPNYTYQGRGRKIRKENRLDALVLVVTGYKELWEYGSVLGYDDNGKGTVWVGNPNSPRIAHELGHLFGLDHHYRDGTRERCIMHVPTHLLGKVKEFSPRNREEIRRVVGWRSKLKKLLLY